MAIYSLLSFFSGVGFFGLFGVVMGCLLFLFGLFALNQKKWSFIVLVILDIFTLFGFISVYLLNLFIF
jgi:hypothetical protein